MASFNVAVRYAKTLLSLSIEKNKVEEVKNDIDLFIKLCRESRPLGLFLRNPVIPNHRKLSIIKKLFKEHFDPLTMTFMDIVTRKNRENILIEISHIFIDKYRIFKGIIIARLETSIEFDQTEKNKLISIIKEKAGKEKKVEIYEHINKNLIGGYVLTIGDNQVDDSVINRLKFFKQKLIVK